MLTRTLTLQAVRVFAALCTLGGCSGDSDPSGPSVALAPCTGAIDVTVSSGTTPTFTWTPACTVAYMIVEEGASDRWLLEATDLTKGIAPGVRYGTVPSGAREGSAAEALVRGRLHDVTMYNGASFSTFAANKQFTP
jgi:hypothetical protein